MAANLSDRSVSRAMLATLFRAGLVGSGLPVQAVYEYQRADFRGIWPVVCVRSAGSSRSKLSTDTTNKGRFRFEVDTFVLHSEIPVLATSNPAAGSNVVISVPDTSLFTVGGTARISDVTGEEIITINAIVANVSVRATTLVASYTTPALQSWTELQSEDTLDLIEKEIADIIDDNFVNDAAGLWIEIDGQSTVDNILVGGRVYRHESIPLVVHKVDS